MYVTKTLPRNSADYRERKVTHLWKPQSWKMNLKVQNIMESSTLSVRGIPWKELEGAGLCVTDQSESSMLELYMPELNWRRRKKKESEIWIHVESRNVSSENITVNSITRHKFIGLKKKMRNVFIQKLQHISHWYRSTRSTFRNYNPLDYFTVRFFSSVF